MSHAGAIMVSVQYDSDLEKMLEALKASDDAHARGKGFEQYVRRLLMREHFKVTLNPGGGRPRQVDLMASRHDVTYLIETSWDKKHAGMPEVDDLFIRLGEVEQSVIGVLVSWNGFAKSAIERVRGKRAIRPMLLVTGQELAATDNLARLLRRKHEHLVTNGEVVFGTKGRPRGSTDTDLPVGSDLFVGKTGAATPWVSGGGGYGRFVFVGELPDIDWVVAPGAGVVVDMDIPMDEGGAVGVLRELTDLGWTTSQGRWCIQQATVNWHGSGAASLADALATWKSRYKGLDEIHHTEEFSYVDACAEGFYSLCGEASADKLRMERRLTMSMQLIGMPVRSESIRHLCDVLGVDDPVFFRPRAERSVVRTRPPERVALDVVGFVTETTRWADDDEEWATGVVVKNPYRRADGGAGRPEWWPEILDDSELVVCALRSWHPLSRAKKSYFLFNCESAWTSDALVIRALADWEDDRPRSGRAPKSVRRVQRAAGKEAIEVVTPRRH